MNEPCTEMTTQVEYPGFKLLTGKRLYRQGTVAAGRVMGSPGQQHLLEAC